MAKIENLGYEEITRRLDSEKAKAQKAEAEYKSKAGKQQEKIDALLKRKEALEAKNREKYQNAIVNGFKALAKDVLDNVPSSMMEKGYPTEEAVSLIFKNMTLQPFAWPDAHTSNGDDQQDEQETPTEAVREHQPVSDMMPNNQQEGTFVHPQQYIFDNMNE